MHTYPSLCFRSQLCACALHCGRCTCDNEQQDLASKVCKEGKTRETGDKRTEQATFGSPRRVFSLMGPLEVVASQWFVFKWSAK
eukprot:2912559-Amphidinium_carterae.1